MSDKCDFQPTTSAEFSSEAAAQLNHLRPRDVARQRHPSSSPTCSISEPFGPIIQRALNGNDEAWRCLVQRLNRLVWKVTLSFDLTTEERNDAYAATVLRLYESLSRVNDPEHLPGWVAMVARNEVFAVLRARRRFDAVLANNPVPVSEPIDDDSIDDDVALRAALRRALKQLPEQAQVLIRLLTATPPLSYADISKRLNIPIGAIGPTRQRTLARLRKSPELVPFLKCRLL
jgi:RNA polymerase sigma factor (sigma-70 family)